MHRSSFIFLRSLVLLGLFAAAAGTASAQYILGSPSSVLNTDGWSLDSSNMSGFRGAITSGSYFGPSGTIHTSISLVDMTAVNAGTLSSLDGLIVPWWNNNQSLASQAAIISAFQNGMDLFLLEDDNQHNGIGTALGITSGWATNAPTQNGPVSNGSSPFFNGPFGTATNVATFQNFDQFFNVGSLHNGQVGGTNTFGETTMAYWAPGTFSPGSGALIVFGDVDFISNANQNPYSPSLNSNGILALNTMAYLVTVPEPGTYALLGVGGVMAIAVLRRRRQQ